ncbi:zinc-dependent alcohol dehydrogenase [Amycolatopsis magusensis]|uniref:2-desacetyl-2-hydroxyethyl bacteriochlorophyllide A dehydrogenase n=1 Tax=Amycolatopsis magusensis TaxID=882444 RepID=A0ABS4PV77_9PSEU|nr:alcohol dehydrogenase catalytic domain-containing protein [Amycolatopsis magusensis]MBP2183334.1 2-desacetyl-2-hydroxyethyl bacteriochlorophyllide A dehydrogenase [Amycolatopsis magusensis]
MNRSVWIDRPGELVVRSGEVPSPGPGEALVRVAWSGICGSDREIMQGTRPAEYVRYPVVPGHEWSGRVAAVGDGVGADLVGAPVVGEGIRSCGVCPACRRGDTNLCDGPYEETGFTQPGAWADHLVVPARLLHRLPETADLRAAAGLEPAACVAAACLKLAVQPGERCAVVGAGMLGLLAVQLLRAAGAGEIVVVHTRRDRAALAAQCGADSLVLPAQLDSLAGCFDVVLEAAGAPGTAFNAVALSRRGGRVALTGIPGAEDQPLDPVTLVLNEITVHTVFGAPPRAWSHAVRAFASGALDPGLLVTHEVSLDDAPEAFRILAEERHKAVKVLLAP